MITLWIYACDGCVDIYQGGQVYSKNKFYKYQNGVKKTSESLPHNANAPQGLGNKVRMGWNWQSIQTISNKYPNEELPSDGVLWGIAEVENGLMKSIGNKGKTFESVVSV